MDLTVVSGTGAKESTNMGNQDEWRRKMSGTSSTVESFVRRPDKRER